MSGDLLTPAQAGRVLDLTSTRVNQLGDAGRIQMTRTALGRLFDARDVERLAQERRAGALSQAAA